MIYTGLLSLLKQIFTR